MSQDTRFTRLQTLQHEAFGLRRPPFGRCSIAPASPGRSQDRERSVAAARFSRR